MSDTEYMTKAEAMAVLGVRRSMFDKLREAGKLSTERAGTGRRVLRVSRSSVERLQAERARGSRPLSDEWISREDAAAQLGVNVRRFDQLRATPEGAVRTYRESVGRRRVFVHADDVAVLVRARAADWRDTTVDQKGPES